MILSSLSGGLLSSKDEGVTTRLNSTANIKLYCILRAQSTLNHKEQGLPSYLKTEDDLHQFKLILKEWYKLEQKNISTVFR